MDPNSKLLRLFVCAAVALAAVRAECKFGLTEGQFIRPSPLVGCQCMDGAIQCFTVDDECSACEVPLAPVEVVGDLDDEEESVDKACADRDSHPVLYNHTDPIDAVLHSAHEAKDGDKARLDVSFSDPISLLLPIALGESSYDTLYLLSVGAVLLTKSGQPLDRAFLRPKRRLDGREPAMVAALMTPMSMGQDSQLQYEVFLGESGQTTIDAAKAALESEHPLQHDAQMLVLVTWTRVLIDDVASTFQLAILASSNATALIVNYACLPFTPSRPRDVVIGYSLGDGRRASNAWLTASWSLLAQLTTLSVNGSTPGRVLLPVSTSPSPREDSSAASCSSWLSAQPRNGSVGALLRSALSSKACPAHEHVAKRSSSLRRHESSSTRLQCYFRKMALQGASYLCCYESGSGHFRSGLSLAVDPASDAMALETELWAFQSCCLQQSDSVGRQCDAYLALRPALPMATTQPNDARALLHGPGLFVTFDGAMLLFSGQGQFVLLQHAATGAECHVAMSVLGEIKAVGSVHAVSCRNSATGSLVELVAGTDALSLLVDKLPADVSQLDAPLDGVLLHGSPLDVEMTLAVGLTVRVSLVRGALQLELSLERNGSPLVNSLVGLLGNADGDASNDLSPRDGKPLSGQASKAQMRALGLSWAEKASALLVTGLTASASAFNLDVSVPAQHEADAAAVCRDNERCRLLLVLSDFVLAVAKAVLAVERALVKAQRLLDNAPPAMTSSAVSDAVLVLRVNSSVSLPVTASDPDGSRRLYLGFSGRLSEGSWQLARTDRSHVTLTWTPSSADMALGGSLSFLATDGHVTTALVVKVALCACADESQCRPDLRNPAFAQSDSWWVAQCQCADNSTGLAVREGALCEDDVDGCRSSPCVGGLCHDVSADDELASGTAFTCMTCDDGFVVNNATGECDDVDECVQAVCDNATSTCVNRPGGHACVCRGGFLWDDASQQCVDVDECVSRRALCDHRCENTAGGYGCSCFPPYVLNGSWACVPGSEPLPPPCANVSCDAEHGGCFVQGSSTACFCQRGYSLSPSDNATCVPEDECATAGTQCAFNCTDLAPDDGVGWRCDCPAGQRVLQLWSCEACPAGSFGFRCSQYCSCEHSSSGRCEAVSGQCLDCEQGWTGPLCEQDVDECANASAGLCPASQTCVNRRGSFSCECPAGFLLSNASVCEDVDECSSGSARCGGTCNNTLGSYTCTCPAGYAVSPVDGASCVDVDECLDEEACSDPMAECVNQEGFYKCRCSQGYVGYGQRCQPASSSPSEFNLTIAVNDSFSAELADEGSDEWTLFVAAVLELLDELMELLSSVVDKSNVSRNVTLTAGSVLATVSVQQKADVSAVQSALSDALVGPTGSRLSLSHSPGVLDVFPSVKATPGSSQSSSNVGAIVGGVLGGVAGLALIAGVVYLAIRGSRAEPWPVRRVARPRLHGRPVPRAFPPLW